MAYYIGCDLGGTNMRAAIVNSESGAVSNLEVVPTLGREGPDGVLPRMVNLFATIIGKAKLSMAEIQGIGIGFPGMIDTERGITRFITNLPGHWIDVPAAAFIEKETGIPTFLLNDVRAITWGEMIFGAGKGCSSMVMYALGTGVGGGIVINGELLLGNSGQAGELGHITVDPVGPLCNCGNRGCLEQYSSGPAIVSAALKAIAHGGTTILGEMVEYNMNKMTPEIVAKAALAGDKTAKNIFEQAGIHLGIAIADSLVHIEPERVVIGGGISRAGELILEPVRRTVRERVFLIPLNKVQITLSELGNDAGVIGTSMWAAHQINKLRKKADG